MAPFAFLVALGSVGTFYLARFWVPFLAALAGGAIAGAVYARERGNRLAIAAMVTAGLGLLLSVVALALGRQL